MWEEALPWPAYLESVVDKRDIWLSHYERAAVSPEEAHRLEHLPAVRRVLVLTEDWCGDAARLVPVLAKAFEASPMVMARYLAADRHPEIVERFLSHGGRSIPVAIVHDERDRPLGAWGPRPAPLQALFRARLRELGRPAPDERGAFYAPVMAWYAKDKGRTALQEVLMLLERGGTPRE